MSAVFKTHLVFLKTILKDVLDNQAASLTKGNFMPHSVEGFIDILHDLGGSVPPSKLEKFLPHVTSVAMDNCFGDPAEELVNHDGLVLFRNRVKRLLYNMATK